MRKEITNSAQAKRPNITQRADEIDWSSDDLSHRKLKQLRIFLPTDDIGMCLVKGFTYRSEKSMFCSNVRIIIIIKFPAKTQPKEVRE